MYFDQARFDLRFEWGLEGLRAVQGGVDAVVVVDVLSFTTAVDVAVAWGAKVYPYRWRDETAREFAESKGAWLAGRRGIDAYSLAPASLRGLPEGSSLVLPSPNGSALSVEIEGVPVFAGCLRNAASVAKQAAVRGRRIVVIAAGEKWPEEHGNTEMRPCIEDLIGAGAVLAGLPGLRSPEAEVAIGAFEGARGKLAAVIAGCSSGRELIEIGSAEDVEIAAEYGVSSMAPVMVDGAFVDDLGQ